MKHLVVYRKIYKYQVDGRYRFDTGIRGYEAQVDSGDGASPWVELTKDGVLWFRHGYSFDGPSGPTIDTADSMAPSLVHDGLYQLLELKLLPRKLRKQADRVFRKMLEENEMGFLRRSVWYLAVRIWPRNWGLGA